jgi:hypothetical protein
VAKLFEQIKKLKNKFAIIDEEECMFIFLPYLSSAATVLEPCSKFTHSAATCNNRPSMPNRSKHRKEGGVVKPGIFKAEAASFGDRGVDSDEEGGVVRSGMREGCEGGVRGHGIKIGVEEGSV